MSENVLVEHFFLGEHFWVKIFGVKFFGVNFFWVKYYLGENFMVENFLGDNFLGDNFLGGNFWCEIFFGGKNGNFSLILAILGLISIFLALWVVHDNCIHSDKIITLFVKVFKPWTSRACEREKKCRSYEFNPTEKRCNLKDPRGKFGDYMFCVWYVFLPLSPFNSPVMVL